MKTTVAAIDFGTSKIVTLVAENSSSLRCDIVGVGVAAYDGFMDDGWNAPGSVNDCIRASIQDAERQGRRKIHKINVGVPATFTRVYCKEVTIELKGTDPRVSAADVRQAFKEAEQKIQQTGGIKVHATPAWFVVDNGKKTLTPVGKAGRELRAMISFVYADARFIEDVSNRLKDLGYDVDGVYATAPGEMTLFLPDEDRDHTAVLIDVGYLTTDVMVAEGDALVYMRSIDIGGGHITADLTDGLDLTMSQAEGKVKRLYSFLGDEEKTYEVPAEDGQPARSFTQKQVAAIVEPRVEEIAELIKEALDKSGIRLGSWTTYYLTGGGLGYNRGAAKFLGSHIGLTIKDAYKRTAKMNEPPYSSALGLVDLIIDTVETRNREAVTVGGRVADWFRSLIGG
ncbi:MAG: pilus assembly protein PilM [Clostridia bacterium]|nr:pilus assembly protein PilM [Clostridia bacterium]